MIKTGNRLSRLCVIWAALAIMLSSSGPVFAIDDGPRAYWKGRAGTNGVSFQYLNLNMEASDAQQFDPGSFIYPNSKTEANIFIVNYARHMTLFNRPSSLGFAVAGGDVNVNVNSNVIPGVAPGSAFSQSASGYADPTIALDVNLFGTPPLKSGVDLLNYEPSWTVDTAVLLALPVGKYDSSKIVNMGQNRWFGRLAFPVKYHFGVFDRGHMSSFEFTPSVWLFAENDDFVGQKLENDPLWQLEAHLTHDFTTSFWGSLDLLHRSGFQSTINGSDLGSELDIGDLGFTLNFQATDNWAIRTGYSSNVFGDDNLDNSIIRLQVVYSWHKLTENIKRLKQGH
jgi:hypothetical protein